MQLGLCGSPNHFQGVPAQFETYHKTLLSCLLSFEVFRDRGKDQFYMGDLRDSGRLQVFDIHKKWWRYQIPLFIVKRHRKSHSYFQSLLKKFQSLRLEFFVCDISLCVCHNSTSLNYLVEYGDRVLWAMLVWLLKHLLD